MKLYACDFDGTLTTRDTLIEFIRFACGTPRFILGFLLHAPLLVLMKLGLYDNGKTKQRVFSWFFKGMAIEDFNRLCKDFADCSRHLLRPDVVRLLEQALAEGAEVLIVSASIDNWVRPFFETEDRSREITILGTQIDIVDGCLTGRFITPNCYGQEKVRRILALHPDRSAYYLTAYGDSRGDREMLAFADESHTVPFC